jgi:enterobacterial common antigen flippase
MRAAPWAADSALFEPHVARWYTEEAVDPGNGSERGPGEPRGWLGRRAVGETAIVNGLLAALGLGTGILTARLLGPNGRGALALGTAIAGLTTVIVGIGLQQAFAYFVAARRDTVEMAASLGIVSGVLAGGGAAALGWLVVPLVVRDATAVAVIRLGLLAVPGTLIASNITGLLQGLRLGRRFNATRLLHASAYCAGVVGVALVEDAATAEGILGVYALAATASAAVAYLLLSPSIASLRSPSRSFITAAMRYGAVAALGGAALAANTHLAIPILGALTGFHETGLYAIGLSYAIPVTLVASAVAIHTLPDVAAASPLARAELVRRRVAITLTGALPLALAAALLAPYVIPAVFGGDFRAAVPAAQILVAAQAFRALAYVLADIARGLGRPGLPSMAETAGVTATVALLPLVVPSLGIEGAAAVLTAANAAVAVVLGGGVRRALRPVAP